MFEVSELIYRTIQILSIVFAGVTAFGLVVCMRGISTTDFDFRRSVVPLFLTPGSLTIVLAIILLFLISAPKSVPESEFHAELLDSNDQVVREFDASSGYVRNGVFSYKQDGDKETKYSFSIPDGQTIKIWEEEKEND